MSRLNGLHDATVDGVSQHSNQCEKKKHADTKIAYSVLQLRFRAVDSIFPIRLPQHVRVARAARVGHQPGEVRENDNDNIAHVNYAHSSGVDNVISLKIELLPSSRRSSIVMQNPGTQI
jgi:hypothetical protein